MSHRHHDRAPVRVWRWPVVIGALTSAGLASALFSDGGWGDHVANACLAIPVGVCCWFGWRPRKP